MVELNPCRNLAARRRAGCCLAMTETIPGRRPVWAILIRVFLAAALAVPALGASAGVVLTNLHSFKVFTNGTYPSAGLVLGSDGSFYGTTVDGGVGLGGTVFRLSVVAPAAPAFQAVTLTHSTLSLTWTTEAGNEYQLQSNSDLDSTDWINLGSARTATGTALSFADSISNGPQRFYRLALLP